MQEELTSLWLHKVVIHYTKNTESQVFWVRILGKRKMKSRDQPIFVCPAYACKFFWVRWITEPRWIGLRDAKYACNNFTNCHSFLFFSCPHVCTEIIRTPAAAHRNGCTVIKMIALDLDGTTLDSHHNLTQTVIQTLRLLSKQGLIVCIATGRSMDTSLMNYIKLLGLINCRVE